MADGGGRNVPSLTREEEDGRSGGGVRTDLALEAARLAGAGLESLPGVDTQDEMRGDVHVYRVAVRDKRGVRATGKEIGHYVTIDALGLRDRNRDLQEQVARALAAELERMLALPPDAHVLVVGLGNWNATPDALGPRVVDGLLVTRHLHEQVPSDMRGDLRTVSAIAPGVLGQTGIETSDIITGIVRQVRPDAVLAVDALAAHGIQRICSTIQLADTGIRPGSGVGSTREGISKESLGVDRVVAVGIPTVVHAMTIASDTIDLVVDRLKDGALIRLSPEEKRRLISEVLSPTIGDLMVTPKEIDQLMEDMARVVAAGINAALHPRVARQPSLF